jgi:hypothetical protein
VTIRQISTSLVLYFFVGRETESGLLGKFRIRMIPNSPDPNPHPQLVIMFDSTLSSLSTMDFQKIMYYTEKKENQIFLIYKEIQNRAVAKSYMTNCLLIYDIWLNICAFPHILGGPSHI